MDYLIDYNLITEKFEKLFLEFKHKINILNNQNIPLENISCLYINIKKQKKKISDISNLFLEKDNLLNIEVFDKNNIIFIKKALLKYNDSLVFNVKKNVLCVKFLNIGYLNKDNKKIQKIEFEKYKLFFKNIRKKYINLYESKSKDDVYLYKCKINDIYNKFILDMLKLLKNE